MLYKGSASANIVITDKMSMSTAAPLAIGTRGTVGSLVRREIEYFRRLDKDRVETSKKPELNKFPGISNTTISASNNSNNSNSNSNSFRSKTSPFGSLLMSGWRRKKRRVSSNNSNQTSFLPSMCSAVEVSESKRFDGIPGFSYRNLKTDIQNSS